MLEFDKTVDLGNVLTSLTILVSVAALLSALAKDRRTRERELSDKIRAAAAKTLGRLERWRNWRHELRHIVRAGMSDPAPSKRVGGDAVFDDHLILELLHKRVVGVFATLNQDGTIHAVPMWFASHERSILLATGSRSRKVANLEADSRSTLVIHDSRPGYEVCGVSVMGDAEIVRGVDAQSLVRRVHRRYVDESIDVPRAVTAFLESDDVAVRFRPHSAFTWDQRETEANVTLRAAAGALPLLTTDARK